MPDTPLIRFAASLVTFAMAGVLGRVVWKALEEGTIRPFRMQRWTEPDPVDRKEDPGAFGFWVVAHGALALLCLGVSVLTLAGRMKLR